MSSDAEWQQLRDLGMECMARIEETGRYIREVRDADAFKVYWRACGEVMGGWSEVIFLASREPGVSRPSNAEWREVLAARRGPDEVVTSLPTALAEVAKVLERVDQLPPDESAAEIAAQLRKDLAVLVVLLQDN